MKKANSKMMKQININIVREAMQKVEMATQPQLASLTKLSVVTINALVKELCERGELFQDKLVPSNGGRPAQAYRYNYDFKLALVLYLKEMEGRELLSITIINLENEILKKKEHSLQIFDKEIILKLIERSIEEFPNISIIGIGIPGQVVDGDITVSSHDELINSNLIQDIEDQFELKVVVENDVNAAISGFCLKEEKKDQFVVGLYFPNRYPPGMGMILDGQPVKGKNGMFGEIKYLPFAPDWKSKMSTHNFSQHAFQIIHTINAVIAPHQIVVYQERVTEDVFLKGWLKYLEGTYMPSLPEITMHNQFQDHFDAGLRRITLQELKECIIADYR